MNAKSPTLKARLLFSPTEISVINPLSLWQVSNMMAFPGPLDYSWASLRSVHCVGSVWAPGFANFLLLFQVSEYQAIFLIGFNSSFVTVDKGFNTISFPR